MEFCQNLINNYTRDDIVIGSILGDAYVSKNGYIQVFHSIKQKEYCLWLANIFKKYFNIKIIERICKDKRNSKEYPQIGFKTNATEYGKLLRKIFYKPQKTVIYKQLMKLSPLGLAIWYMDDGSLTFVKKDGLIKGRQIYLFTNSFSYEENTIIQKYFQDVYDIKCGIHKDSDGYRIWMNGTEARKFLSIIYPYMPSCMYYKVCYRYFGYKSSQNLCGHKCESGNCPYNIV